jgi:hypothetical protein
LHVEFSGAKRHIGPRLFPLAERIIETMLLNGEPLTPAAWGVQNDGTVVVRAELR